MEKFINTGNKDTRSGFGAGLTELGRTNDKVVALCADLTGSLKMNTFAKEHPDRFFQCGIAEADMIDVAAGLSLSGRIPFAGSFANFVTSRVYDQIRQGICYASANVKIAASHAGITLGEDGATHQVMEDDRHQSMRLQPDQGCHHRSRILRRTGVPEVRPSLSAQFHT